MFNPFVLRWPKVLGYVFDFQRTNRRMHNKSLTADNQASIVGGRNIGNEYFGNPQGVLFADLDVLAWGRWCAVFRTTLTATGPALQPTPSSASSPTLRFGLAHLAPAHCLAHASTEGQRYQTAKANSQLAAFTSQRSEAILWAPARLVSDDPAKVLGQARQQGLIGAQLARAIGQPSIALDMVSPYFVPHPGRAGCAGPAACPGHPHSCADQCTGGHRCQPSTRGLRALPRPCCAWALSCTSCSASPH